MESKLELSTQQVNIAEGDIYRDTDKRRKDLNRAIRVKSIDDRMVYAAVGAFVDGVFAPNGSTTKVKAERLTPHCHWQKVEEREDVAA